MAVKPIGTTALTWGSLLGRGNREPIDATQLNYSYTDLLWELNQRTVSYQIGTNNGGSGNYYVGLITAVPYVNEDDKRKDSHYTVDANGNKKLETIDMKGPWYVSYKGTDKGRGTAQNKYGFVPDGNPNTYYADRIVLKQEMDYTLDNGFVRKTQLGTYYTGVGHWYDSYTKSKTYANGLECPDGVYFPTTSYAEIFNDYTHNVATGKFSHAEGSSTTASGGFSHTEGSSTTASGGFSHAEGGSNTASGDYSHAEGYSTKASGLQSHAEGGSTTASGKYSHAEGYSTTASAHQSHAEGLWTKANGESSHAEGHYTKATNLAEHAQGRFNVSDTNNSGTLFTIGNGTADDKRHNVVSIYCNGDINIEGQNTTNHNIGYFKSAIDGNYTQTIGTVGENNTCNVTINGTSDTRISGATYEGYDSTFISTTKDAKSTYSYSTTYTYSEGDVTNTTAGTRTVVTDGDVSITNKANIDIATNGTHTENIDTTRSVVVVDHDSLVVNSNGRTEKITGEKIIQVISGNINAYTDSTHDTRLNTRSAYLETVHAYIGDNTNTAIDGNYSVGLGQGIKVSSDTNATVGKYNKDEASYFAVGIGTDDVNRKNAFWISQSNDAGSNGICYFSDNTYVYGNTYDPGQYPDNKEDKSWSPVVTYNMYRNSYECLYNIIIDKLDIVDQYNSIMNRLKKLEEEVIWRSRIGVNGTNVLNKATYLWTGTLNEFNSLESKPADTTFIISN